MHALTYDGYFSLIVPVCTGNFELEVLFGAHYEWLQIENIDYVYFPALYTNSEMQQTISAWKNSSYKKMTIKKANLLECLSKESSLLISPPPEITNQQFVIRIVFRPIA